MMPYGSPSSLQLTGRAHFWHPTGEGGDGVGGLVGLPGIAPLGEHLGGVDLTRPWQRREDRAVRVFSEVGGDGAVEGLHRGVQGRQDGDRGEHGVAQCLGERLIGGASRPGAHPGEQLGGGAAAGVAVFDAERGHPLLAQVRGGGRGGVAGGATSKDRHPGFHQVPTTSTLSGAREKDGALVTSYQARFSDIKKIGDTAKGRWRVRWAVAGNEMA